MTYRTGYWSGLLFGSRGPIGVQTDATWVLSQVVARRVPSLSAVPACPVRWCVICIIARVITSSGKAEAAKLNRDRDEQTR
jgi:hypothetical protein